MKAEPVPTEAQKNLTLALVLCLSLLAYPTKRERVQEIATLLATASDFKGDLEAVMDDAVLCCCAMAAAKRINGANK